MCDWICKNRSKSHKNWNPFYCWTLKVNSCTTQKRQTHGYKWQHLLSQKAFRYPCLTTKVHYRVFGLVNGINKNVSGTTLLPATVSTYPVHWVYFCHLLKTQHRFLCCNGRYNLLSATHQPPPHTPLPPTHPPTHPYNVLSVILQSLWRKLLKTQQC